MSERKRQGMYLSPTDDSVILLELARCKERGRKSTLLRNYAVLGYQSAVELCEDTTLTPEQLKSALALLFAPEGAPPDYRAAETFIKARDAMVGQKTEAAARVPGPSPAAPAPKVDDLPSPAPSKKEHNWRALSGLVAAGRGGGASDKGSS